ncbi:ion channel protein [Actinocorallia aurantiaca]|uniref:Ion channel protein n=1 Tax=Actinocorallia aurantiaca TaxID=46204 RepID=A0ABN3UA85_9ACTN
MGTARALLPLTIPALVVGVGAALLLTGVSRAAEELSRLLWLPESPWWTLLMLTLGGFLTGLILWKTPGHGGPDPATEGLVAPPIPVSAVPGVLLALSVTLAFGVSLGPENPTIVANVALATALGHRFLPRAPLPVWTALAMAGTLGGLFGTPVAAALLLSETPSESKAPLWDRLVAPLVAAGAGALTVHLVSPGLTFTLGLPPYRGFQPLDLVTGSVLAALGCALGLAAVYALPRVHRFAHRIGHPVVLLTLGGLVLGVLGMIGGRITLFKGLEQMQELARDPGAFSAPRLALIIAVKLTALVVAASVGFRGGRIFPSVFLGVALGMLAAALVPGVPMALAVACAAMGVCVAVSRSGWLSLFLGAILVGGQELLPVLCVAILPAWLLATGRPEMRAEAVASPSPG